MNEYVEILAVLLAMESKSRMPSLKWTAQLRSKPLQSIYVFIWKKLAPTRGPLMAYKLLECSKVF